MGGGGGEGDYIPIATLSLPESVSDSSIKMGSNERHFNVSLESLVSDSHTAVSTNHNLFRREKTADELSN